jgi:Protoglobin
MLETHIAGYDYGKVGRSPLTLNDLERLQETAGFTEDDRRALDQAADILEEEAESLVDEWREIIGGHEQLARWFFGHDGKPDDRYKAAVKPRFVRWVTDTCRRPFDQVWLDYQYEIGLRHTPAKKNATDRAATPPLVPLRYMIAFIVPVVAAAKKRFDSRAASAEDAERMHAAWTKAVVLSIAIWAMPYTREGLW